MSYNNESAHFYHSKPKLPPLKEHLKDVFKAHPAAPGYDRASNRSHPSTQASRHHSASNGYGVNGDPYHQHSHYSHSSSHVSQTQRTHSTNPQHSTRHTEGDSPPYQYSVYRSTQDDLTLERSSTRDAFRTKPAKSTHDLSKRHVCSECGDRFDRPGSLETHIRSHTGERPYSCSHPGCHKSFSVHSNMRRHERTHYAESRFEPVDGGDSTSRSGSSRHAASSHTSAFPAQHYSYSRAN